MEGGVCRTPPSLRRLRRGESAEQRGVEQLADGVLVEPAGSDVVGGAVQDAYSTETIAGRASPEIRAKVLRRESLRQSILTRRSRAAVPR